MSGVVYVVAIGCVIWAVVAAVKIAVYMSRKGHKVSFLWLRLMILKYLHEYARVTREENGRVGPLFYHYVVPLNLALVLVILFVIFGRA